MSKTSNKNQASELDKQSPIDGDDQGSPVRSSNQDDFDEMGESPPGKYI